MDSKDRKHLLDVEYIQEKLDKGYKYTEEAKGRDLVLVIGNTGVGKSTTCNYLMGYQMKEAKFSGRHVIETIEETDIKIGHEVKPETLYAKSFIIDCGKSESLICLLDCPGFLGTRTVEDKVIESISTELAIRSARQIKGILILISLNTLQVTSVKELKELVNTLIKLFKDPVEMVRYSIFIITKTQKYMPEEVAKKVTIGALNTLIMHCENQGKKLRDGVNVSSSEGITSVDYDRIAIYFSAVLKNTENIIFVNPLDNGESRKTILDRINDIKDQKWHFKEFLKAGAALAIKAVSMKKETQLRPIAINDFTFSEGNEDRVKFNKALYHRSREGNNLISNVQRCSETNRICYTEIQNSYTTLAALETLKCNLEEEISKVVEGKIPYSKVDFKSIRNFESMIEENEKQIKCKESDIKKIKSLKGELYQILKSIDTEEPLLFIEKSVDRDGYINLVDITMGCFEGIFGCEEMEFSADTGDSTIEIINVIKSLENGEWLDEVDERQNGKYQITYKSDSLTRPAKASVKTYIKSKDEEGNKISIAKIKGDLDRLKENKRKLKSDIFDLQSNNEALQLTVKRAKGNVKDYKNNLKQKLEECKNDMHRLNTFIVKMKEDKKQAMTSGMKYLEEFDRNQRKFDIVVSIATLLEFPSTLIKNFISQYKDFISCVDNYRSSFAENSVDSLPFAYEKESKERETSSSLKDPITGEEVKRCVVTLAGTMFDEQSLLKQFDRNLKNPLPFIFRREDGTTEKIEYFSWWTVPDIHSYTDSLHKKISHLQSLTPLCIETDINKMDIEQLEEHRGKLSKIIPAMKEDVEVKETDLERVCRRLERLKSVDQSENSGIKTD